MTYSIHHAILLSAKNEILGKFHSTTKEQAVKLALKKARKGQKVFTITDKQFGMTINSWDGAPRMPKWGRPLIAHEGACISTYPLTLKQYNSIVIK